MNGISSKRRFRVMIRWKLSWSKVPTMMPILETLAVCWPVERMPLWHSREPVSVNGRTMLSPEARWRTRAAATPPSAPNSRRPSISSTGRIFQTTTALWPPVIPRAATRQKSSRWWPIKSMSAYPLMGRASPMSLWRHTRRRSKPSNQRLQITMPTAIMWIFFLMMWVKLIGMRDSVWTETRWNIILPPHCCRKMAPWRAGSNPR